MDIIEFIKGEDIFNKALTKAIENTINQGVLSIPENSHKLDPSDVICLYNGPGGSHCAVGWFVTEENRHALQDYLNPDDGPIYRLIVKSHPDINFNTRHIKVLKIVQSWHDACALNEAEMFAKGKITLEKLFNLDILKRMLL